jgi:hypothetical protein
MKKTIVLVAAMLVCGMCWAQEVTQTGRFATVRIEQHLVQVDSLTGRCWILAFEESGPIFKPIVYSGIDGNLRLMPEPMNEIAVLEDKLVRRQDEIKQKQEILKKMLEKKKQEEAAKAGASGKIPSPAPAEGQEEAKDDETKKPEEKK